MPKLLINIGALGLLSTAVFLLLVAFGSGAEIASELVTFAFLLLGGTIVIAPIARQEEKIESRAIGVMVLSFFAGFWIDNWALLFAGLVVLAFVALWLFGRKWGASFEDVSVRQAFAYAFAVFAATAPIRMLSNPYDLNSRGYLAAALVTGVCGLLAYGLAHLKFLPLRFTKAQ